MTNFEKIKAMSIDEMHEFLKELCYRRIINGEILDLPSVQGLSYNDMLRVWLESETE